MKYISETRQYKEYIFVTFIFIKLKHFAWVFFIVNKYKINFSGYKICVTIDDIFKCLIYF